MSETSDANEASAAAKTPAWREITDEDELVEFVGPETGPAIIDMWAPWCGPCKAMAPHFEAVAEHYRDDPIGFYKINTEAHPDLSRMFNVRSLPTLILVMDGKVEDIIIGASNGDKIAKRAEWLLSKARGDGFFTRLLGLGKKS